MQMLCQIIQKEKCDRPIYLEFVDHQQIFDTFECWGSAISSWRSSVYHICVEVVRQLRVIFLSNIAQRVMTKLFKQCMLTFMTYGTEAWLLLSS